jgi:CBS domain containing-hemolysin-like protein
MNVPVATGMFIFMAEAFLQESWLNPDFATDQLVVVAVVILACLIVLPVVFGGLIYLTLSLIARLQHRRRTNTEDAMPEPGEKS